MDYTKADAYFGGRLPGGISPGEAQQWIGREGDKRAAAVVVGLVLVLFLLGRD